jgi:hypothetical protein
MPWAAGPRRGPSSDWSPPPGARGKETRRITDPTNPRPPPRLSVGYSDDGVVLYRVDEHGVPTTLALMDPIAARRYSLDPQQVAEHLLTAGADYEAHLERVADIDNEIPPTLGA